MTLQNKINWLKRFSELWDMNTDANGADHVNWLIDIYDRFIKKHELPEMCALELTSELECELWGE